MPFFDHNPLSSLADAEGRAQAELDLRGLQFDEALRRVELLLSDVRTPGAASYLIRFDPAVPGRGETLFLPLGRRLLAARRAGILDSCLPLPDGAAYYIGLSTGNDN
jgi:hypothetical protein